MISAETGEYLRSLLLGVKIKLFMENVGISNKSYLLSIFYETTSSINRFDAINRTSAGSNLFGAAGDSVSLIIADANISGVANEGSISFFADKKNVVSILKRAI